MMTDTRPGLDTLPDDGLEQPIKPGDAESEPAQDIQSKGVVQEELAQSEEHGVDAKEPRDLGSADEPEDELPAERAQPAASAEPDEAQTPRHEETDRQIGSVVVPNTTKIIQSTDHHGTEPDMVAAGGEIPENVVGGDERKENSNPKHTESSKTIKSVASSLELSASDVGTSSGNERPTDDHGQGVKDPGDASGGGPADGGDEGEPPDDTGENDEDDPRPEEHINMPELVIRKLDKPVPSSFQEEVALRYFANDAAVAPDTTGDQLEILNGLKDGKTPEELAEQRGTSITDINLHLELFGENMRRSGFDLNFLTQVENPGLARAPLFVRTAIDFGLIDRPADLEEMTGNLTAVQESELFLKSQGYTSKEIADRMGEAQRTYSVNVSDQRLRARFGATTDAHMMALAESHDAIPELDIILGKALRTDAQDDIVDRAERIENVEPFAMTDRQRIIVTGLGSDKTRQQIADELGVDYSTITRDLTDLTRQIGGDETMSQPELVYLTMVHGLTKAPPVANPEPDLTSNENLQLYLSALRYSQPEIATLMETEFDVVRSASDSMRRKFSTDAKPIRSMQGMVGQMFANGFYKSLPVEKRTTVQRLVPGVLRLADAGSIDAAPVRSLVDENETSPELESNVMLAISGMEPGEFLLFDDVVPEADMQSVGLSMQLVEERRDTEERSIPGRHASRRGGIIMPSREVLYVNVHPFNISADGSETHQVATAYEVMRGTSELARSLKDQRVEVPVGFVCTTAIDADGNPIRQVSLLSLPILIDDASGSVGRTVGQSGTRAGE